MDKSLTTIVFIILSTCFVNGQVNWNEYNEPDGNYLRWYVLPFLDIGYSENQFQEDDSQNNNRHGRVFLIDKANILLNVPRTRIVHGAAMRIHARGLEIGKSHRSWVC